MNSRQQPAAVAVHQQPRAEQKQQENEGGNHDDPHHVEARRGLLHMSRDVGTDHKRWDAAAGAREISVLRKTIHGLFGGKRGCLDGRFLP